MLEPLKLTSTGLFIQDSANKDKAVTGYDAEGNPQAWTRFGWTNPSGQLFSSVRDMATFASQFLGAVPGRFEDRIDNATADSLRFAPQTLRELLRPVFFNADVQSGFGSSWEMQVVEGHYLRCAKESCATRACLTPLCHVTLNT